LYFASIQIPPGRGVRCGLERHDPRNAALSTVSWFYLSGDKLRYRGRITRQPFAAWASTPDGEAAIDATARQLGFCLFGRTRTARRRMWRSLHAVATSDAVRATLEQESERFLAVWSELAYAPALPRVTIALHRLVVVPRTMIAARSLSGLTSRLMSVPSFAALDAPLRAFLCDRFIWEMDAAIRRRTPSPRRPVSARESWACVAIDERFVWVDPMWSGRDWQGHVMMFEMPAAGASRKERREIEAAVAKLQASLPQLSVGQRDGAVRTASAALTASSF
jgi:hypothetical protein